MTHYHYQISDEIRNEVKSTLDFFKKHFESRKDRKMLNQLSGMIFECLHGVTEKYHGKKPVMPVFLFDNSIAAASMLLVGKFISKNQYKKEVSKLMSSYMKDENEFADGVDEMWSCYLKCKENRDLGRSMTDILNAETPPTYN